MKELMDQIEGFATKMGSGAHDVSPFSMSACLAIVFGDRPELKPGGVGNASIKIINRLLTEGETIGNITTLQRGYVLIQLRVGQPDQNFRFRGYGLRLDQNGDISFGTFVEKNDWRRGEQYSFAGHELGISATGIAAIVNLVGWHASTLPKSNIAEFVEFNVA